MDNATYQLMLDDLGDLVAAYDLNVADMMNQSPRNVLLDCIKEANRHKAALDHLQGANDVYYKALAAISPALIQYENLFRSIRHDIRGNRYGSLSDRSIEQLEAIGKSQLPTP